MFIEDLADISLTSGEFPTHSELNCAEFTQLVSWMNPTEFVWSNQTEVFTDRNLELYLFEQFDLYKYKLMPQTEFATVGEEPLPQYVEIADGDRVTISWEEVREALQRDLTEDQIQSESVEVDTCDTGVCSLKLLSQGLGDNSYVLGMRLGVGFGTVALFRLVCGDLRFVKDLSYIYADCGSFPTDVGAYSVSSLINVIGFMDDTSFIWEDGDIVFDNRTMTITLVSTGGVAYEQDVNAIKEFIETEAHTLPNLTINKTNIVDMNWDTILRSIQASLTPEDMLNDRIVLFDDDGSGRMTTMLASNSEYALGLRISSTEACIALYHNILGAWNFVEDLGEVSLRFRRISTNFNAPCYRLFTFS